MASVALTVFGVHGQLAMIVAAHAGRGVKWGIGVAFGLAALAVLAYAVFFVRGTLAVSLPPDPAQSTGESPDGTPTPPPAASSAPVSAAL